MKISAKLNVLVFYTGMRILGICPTISYNKQTSFKSHSRKIYDEEGDLLYRTTTWPYRGDLDWDGFVNLLNRKYSNVDKVNIVDYACSFGTEPFCLVAKLIKLLKHKADKFFPIIAKDIDAKNIEIAKTYKLPDDIYGLIDMKYGLGEDYKEYFDTRRLLPVFPEKYTSKAEIVPKKFLQDKVIFEQADILKDIDNIPKSNTVVLIRNVWPYLKPEQREELAKKLATNFDDTCLFVVGGFDKEKPEVCNIDEIFRRHGLKHTRVLNVWCKPKAKQ